MALSQRLFIAAVVSFTFFAASGQTRQVYGKVTNNGEALSGANVMIKGTIAGTVTDRDGTFAIDVPVDKSVVLLFSFMGPLIERRISKNEQDIHLDINSGIGPHAVYFLAGPSFAKLSGQRNNGVGFMLSAAYRYLYHRFGIGAEVNLQQGTFSPEGPVVPQIGVPVIGYYRITNRIKAQLGSGFYFTKDRRQEPDVKVITGLTYEKAYWGFNFRYMNGTRRFGDVDAVTQNWQLAFQYRVQ